MHIRTFNITIMRKSLLIFLLLALIPVQGCLLLLPSNYHGVKSYSDDLNNEQRYLLSFRVFPKEGFTGIGTASLKFDKRGHADNSTIMAFASIVRTSDSFRTEGNGYLKAGDTVLPLALKDVSVESDYSVSDTDDDSDPSVTRVNNEKFRFELTPDMAAAIRNCRRLELRFYFGPEPATYRIRGMELRKLKQLVNK